MGALIYTLTPVDHFLEAAPFSLCLFRPKSCQLTEPVNEESRDEGCGGEFGKCIGHEAWLVDVYGVQWIIE